MKTPVKRGGRGVTLRSVRKLISRVGTPSSTQGEAREAVRQQSKTKKLRQSWKLVECLLLKDEATGIFRFEYHFDDGLGSEIIQAVDAHLPPRLVAAELQKLTTNHVADRDIEAAQQNVDRVIVGTSRPGWKFEHDVAKAFVTPDFAVADGARYRWTDRASAYGLGRASGDWDGWRALIDIASRSNYASFAILTAFAAPVVRFSGLAELPIFNFFGESSTGKTTILKMAKATSGDPAKVSDWHASPRGYEELSAAHNDMILIMNAAEKISSRKRADAIRDFTHTYPDGISQNRSTFVQDKLPSLSWRGLVLSSANQAASIIVEEWADQDAARMIDIPVPPAKCGGVFDLIRQGDGFASSDLIRRVDALLEHSYGLPIRTFLTAILTKSATSATPFDFLSAIWSSFDIKTEMPERIQEFMEIVEPEAGVDQRIARKFGAVFAAGQLAYAAGLLPQTPFFSRLPMVEHLYRLAKQHRRGNPSGDGYTLAALKSLVKGRAGFRDKAGSLGEGVFHECDVKGTRAYAFRREAVEASVGKQSADAIMSYLFSKGVSFPGQGKRNGIQKRVDVDGSTKKLRFVMVDADKVDALIAANAPEHQN